MQALESVLKQTSPSVQSVVVFLGDNAYRQPPLSRKLPRWPDLDGQIRASAGADEVFFVPGNHDWGESVDDGVAVLTRERDYVRATGGPHVHFEPTPGCPGPVRIADSAALRMVVVDSTWFLRDTSERGPLARERGCKATTRQEVGAQLRAELACAVRPCPVRVVIAHHPLRSGGGHAGYFAWRDHILCTGLLPMPGVCSLVIALRKMGISSQDMASAGYAEYIEAVETALPDDVVVVSGHEHALQVIRDGRLLQLVSGAGSRVSSAGRIDGTEYVRAELGFIVGDFTPGGRAVFRVMTVRGGVAAAQEEFAAKWP